MPGPLNTIIALALPGGEAVAMWDGSSLWEDDAENAYAGARVFSRDVGSVVRVIATRPLARWRYWHRRGVLIRAQKKSEIIRDYSGLYDVTFSKAEALESRELFRPWDALALIHEWCLANGLRSHTSAGAAGVELLSKKFTPNFPPLYADLAAEERLRDGLYGGRAETFGNDGETINGTVIYYDANGAYLDVMRSVEMPYPYHYLPFPNLHAEGMTDCLITETGTLPVLPVRDKGFLPGRKRGTWTNREIRYAIECGARLHKVYGGIHYVRTTRVLQPLGEWLAEQREREQRPALRAFLKKIPNALIGRFASAPTVCVTRQGDAWKTEMHHLTALKVAARVWSVEIPLRRRSPWYAVGWSAAILAEQRIRLHQSMASLAAAGYRVVYCDTDGIMLEVPDWLPLPPVSREIGKFKVEWIATGVAIRGIKCYVAQAVDGSMIHRQAGTARVA